MAGKVGFIGLGAMGGPMALNLVKAGHKLVVHDIDQSKTAAVRAQGAELAGNAEAVAAAVDRTILIVETTDQAQSVIVGERGIIKGAVERWANRCLGHVQNTPMARRRPLALPRRALRHGGVYLNGWLKCSGCVWRIRSQRGCERKAQDRADDLAHRALSVPPPRPWQAADL